MGFGFEESGLWLSSLAQQPGPDPHVRQRALLAAAYHQFRERAALVAAEIPQDLREYTVHDVTHLDALWELATEISGAALKLTPTEAFVLGGAFLVHDLGMGLAAWPGGLDQLRQESSWKDILSSCIRQVTGGAVTSSLLDSPPEHAQKMALEIALRERHAFQASELALTSWTSKGSGAVYHLIEDADLRQRYGELIGEIAASHWWDIEQVAERFSGKEPIGAPVDCPDDWVVDELKLACLMRTADAAHLDERRAPGFLRALRAPRAYSDLHWSFQGYLQRPRRSDDRLVFTSARSFGLSDAQAWWVCNESLQLVDRELKAVDALLVDRAKQRFDARGVRGIEDPARLSEYIRTAGWSPVDAQPRIDNVPALVRRLGGESLYGEDPTIALRELIQNARDASKALESLLGDSPKPISVEITMDENDAWYLRVSDCGVGMSGAVLRGSLLDFGGSLWGSDLLRRELPGLGASDFEAVGRFGIGFYSVFMLGDEVTVVSRRYDEASAETKVLEFVDGVASRPILRPAGASEIKHAGGTTVSIKLRCSPIEEGGLLARNRESPLSLAQAAAYVAPALDCDIRTTYLREESKIAVSANDWLTMTGVDLLRRIAVYREYDRVFPHPKVDIQSASQSLRVMGEGANATGRISLAPSPPVLVDGEETISASSCVVIGGLRAAGDLGGIAGIVAASPTKADRMAYSLDIAPASWAAWSSEQTQIWSEHVNRAVRKGGYTEEDSMVRLAVRLGGDLSDMPICHRGSEPMNVDEFSAWAGSRNEITVIDSYFVDVQVGKDGEATIWHTDDHCELDLDESVVTILRGGRYGSWEKYGDPFPDKTYQDEYDARKEASARGAYFGVQSELEGLAVRLIANAWGKTTDELLQATDRAMNSSRDPVMVGVDPSGEPHFVSYAIWHMTR